MKILPTAIDKHISRIARRDLFMLPRPYIGQCSRGAAGQRVIMDIVGPVNSANSIWKSAERLVVPPRERS
jgi:hypothetical protein